MKGVRAGGDLDRVKSLETALHRTGRPLTVEELEAAVLLQWDRVEYEERRQWVATDPVAPGVEAFGFARLYPPAQTSALPGQVPAYSVAASWYGWLPGVYATREAAVMAYGYVLGGETPRRLEDLRDQVLGGEGRPVEVRDFIALADAIE